MEKDFTNVVTCKLQILLSHIEETGLCLPTVAEYLYPIVEQLCDVGLLMTIGSHCDKLEDHLLLLNISKLTNEVHKLLFSNSAIDKPKNLYASMGVLPQTYLNSILPEHINADCLVQLQYCQPFSHVEVKANYLTPTEDSSSPTLFYFPGLCTADKNEVIEGTYDFKYFIGFFIECKVEFDYFPPRFLHVLLLRLAYKFALPAAHVKISTSHCTESDLATVQHYNRRCIMWKNGIHWLMEEGVKCFVETVNNSKGVIVITKSMEEQKFTCSGMLFKIIGEIQQAKEEFCETVALEQYLMDSDDPASSNNKNKLFAMTEVERVLREGRPSIISVNGKGHLDAAKVAHLMKFTLWGKF